MKTILNTLAASDWDYFIKLPVAVQITIIIAVTTFLCVAMYCHYK